MAHGCQKNAFGLIGRFGSVPGFPQSTLESLALSDVADRTGDQQTFLGLERTQGDFGREFAAILAQTEEFEAGAHRTSPGSSEKLCSQLRMLSAKAFRHESFHSLMQQLRSWISEQFLSL